MQAKRTAERERQTREAGGDKAPCISKPEIQYGNGSGEDGGIDKLAD